MFNEKDFDFVMDVCGKIDSEWIGDMADWNGFDGRLGLCMALVNDIDPYGNQVGFLRENGAWVMIVWGALENRRPDYRLATIRSTAKDGDGIDIVAAECVRLIEYVATNVLDCVKH